MYHQKGNDKRQRGLSIASPRGGEKSALLGGGEEKDKDCSQLTYREWDRLHKESDFPQGKPTTA